MHVYSIYNVPKGVSEKKYFMTVRYGFEHVDFFRIFFKNYIVISYL